MQGFILMGKQTFKYILLCTAIYGVLSLIEILIKPLIEMIDNGYWTIMIVYNVLLLIINPIATYFIVNKCFKFETGEIKIEPIIEKQDITRDGE